MSQNFPKKNFALARKHGLCFDFLEGHCRFGSSCKYRHDNPGGGVATAGTGNDRTRNFRAVNTTAGNSYTSAARPGNFLPGNVRPGDVRPGKVRSGKVRPAIAKAGSSRNSKLSYARAAAGDAGHANVVNGRGVAVRTGNANTIDLRVAAVADAVFAAASAVATRAAPAARIDQEYDGDSSSDGELTDPRVELWRNTLLKSKGFNCFLELSHLVSIDDATRQEVIDGLASKAGLKKVQEICELDFSSMKADRLLQIFLQCILPLFQTITDQRLHASATLETRFTDIYGKIFGVDGHTAIALYTAIIPLLRTLRPSKLPFALATTSAVLLRVIEFNEKAESIQEFKAFAFDLHGMIGNTQDQNHSFLFAQAKRHVKRIQKHIFDHEERTAMKKKSTKSATATFEFKQAGPGRLKSGLPRHDNDIRSIQHIRIMPTSNEILSPHQEYLPLRDPSTWHKDGLAGLIDRQFRLLREETMSPICGSARAELQTLQRQQVTGKKRRKQEFAHAHIYQNARVDYPNFDSEKGLEFVISFDQPWGRVFRSFTEREKWWSNSRRLQGEAFMCLLSSCGAVLFCTVVGVPEWEKITLAKMRAKRLREGLPPVPLRLHEEFKLFSDPNRAYIVARPVNLDTESIALLDIFIRRYASERRSLMEFPRVLVQAFMPTLTGMQALAKNPELPFSEFLAPPQGITATNDTLAHVPIPVYAQRPGFQFDLNPITNGDTILSFDPRTLAQADVDALTKTSTLDKSQASALLQSLSRSLALIQGPPGTGKSFTGIAMIKTLLANKDAGQIGPILCVCYTNHALDQLLEHLLDQDVTQIVRIGGGSKSERLADVTLNKLLRSVTKTKVEKTTQQTVKFMMRKSARAIKDILGDIDRAESMPSIKIHLERTSPRHFAELFDTVKEDDWTVVETPKPDNILTQWLRRGPAFPDRSVTELNRFNVHTLSLNERRKLYSLWIEDILAPLQEKLKAEIENFNHLKTQLERSKNKVITRVLDEANVIGLTTSGLAMRLDILRKLPAKVLLVEEAGEVLESHLIMALLPSIEHAILIGDHLQLRPHCQNHLSMESKEGQQYAMDQSLFERLVQPVGESFVELPFSRLEIQRRMHPAIARLVRDTLYPTLVDTSPEYPEVMGMKNRLSWFNHQHAEDDNNETTSFTNDWEAEMVTAFVHHLIKQGTYEAGEIAVLTPYLAQLERLRDRMGEVLEIVLGERDVDELETKGRIEPTVSAPDSATGPVPVVATLENAVRIATVDNFQGEEAKIIIVSLVRSNHRKKCGFLKTSNRINVLLSRAKHGMYIIGDRSAPENVKMWSKVLDILEETKCIGPTLEIQCQQHPQKVSQIYGPDDFMRYAPDGGCGELCGKQLSCGHACPVYYHSELLHDIFTCIEPCARLLKTCEHACPKLCHEACPEECKVELEVNIALPCDHVLTSVPCHLYQNQDQIVCKELVEPMVPACGHIVQVSCSVDVRSPDFYCDEQCGVSLSCGHHCQSVCHQCRPKVDGKILEVEHKPCQEPCRKPYPDCTHRCERACHDGVSCGSCPQACETQCAHSRCNRECAEPCLPCPACMKEDYDDEASNITAMKESLRIQTVEKQYLCDNDHIFTTDVDNIFVRKGKCPQCSAPIVEHASAPPAVVEEEDQCNPQ